MVYSSIQSEIYMFYLFLKGILGGLQSKRYQMAPKDPVKIYNRKITEPREVLKYDPPL